MVFDKQGSNYRINLKSFQILDLNIVLIQISYQQLLKHLSQSLLNRERLQLNFLKCFIALLALQFLYPPKK